MNFKKLIIVASIISILEWPLEVKVHNWLTERSDNSTKTELVLEGQKSILDEITFE